MALSTVGEWFGSAIISKLVDTAYSYLAEQMLPADIESELRRLEEALPMITAVMGVAEALKLKDPNPGVNAWLARFKEAFFAAEDVLDELKYWELADMVKNRDEVSGSSSLKRKFTSSAIISKDTLKRLRGSVELLDRAATNVGHFLQLATALAVNKPVYTSSRETTSLLTETKVFGREREKAIIIDWLKKPASYNSISAFCIVGAGGLGKTTLAQLIFDEISKENHFDKTIWICVSTSFSVEDITRKILQELGEKIHDNESLNRLQINLKEKIISKKILFILDDVWNDDKMCDWENLIAPLKFVQQGSKILLTTRMKSVADMLAHVLHVERENIVLGGLKGQELLELFNKHAFNNYNSDNYKDLQNIGNDIVKKLRGSPLAAKVIGSLLNFNMDFHYWKRILSYDSLINLEQVKGVADVLKLSYYHLPADLQECFRFCSIFPQDYKFNKDELIRMWMALGFIRQDFHGEDRQEDIGEEYFNHLLRKSFFERYPYDNVYVMHDLLHDLAQNVSKGECSRVEPESKINIIPSSAQHVCVHESQIQWIFNLRNLRSLVITLSGEYGNRDRFVLPNGSLKETLRLLVIRGRCELPEEFSHLIHLRFLKIDPGFVRNFPEFFIPNSIYKLYHMQVLDWTSINPGGLTNYLSSDNGFETTGITNLVSLRYMDLPNQAMENIHGVHKLTSLRKLNFSVGQECGRHIDELGTLNNLQSLSIKYIENVGDPIEARKANLSKKKSLITLSLNWTFGGNSGNNNKQVIDNLQPHSNLKKLKIMGYAGHISPIWMMDSSHLYLSSLTLSFCRNWETLPYLGQMPHLKLLSLSHMNNVKEVDYSCDSTRECAFPSLEKLYCGSMPKWESWAAAHISYGFPNLKELVITCCPNLSKLPAIPFSLFKFQVRSVGINSLPDMHHGSSITAPAPSCMKSSLRVVDIQDCPKLTSLNGFMEQDNLDLQALEDLTIADCENLVQLPTGAFGNFVSLKHLSIMDIPNLVIVDKQSILLPIKLESLNMENCGELDVPLLESTSQLLALATLFIKDSEHITCIPTGAFANFVSLKHLSIMDIPNLVIVDNQSIHLPIKLESLEMRNCGELDVPLLESASQLPALVTLYIGGSEHITSIPSSENAFTSLSKLKIMRCNKLIELSSMQQAHTVNPGNNLVSLKISDLEIDHLCLLLIEPLKCLRFVRFLDVHNCSEMEALPDQWLLQNSSTLKSLTISDANSLRSLPGTMVMLTSLQNLNIYKATSLEEIPEMPASLIYKNITRDSLFAP